MNKLIALVSLVFLIGCAVPVVVENPPGSGILSTNLALDPRFTNTMAAIGAANDATAPFNPWYGLVGTVLGAVSAGAAAWVKIRNQANQIKSLKAKSD